MTSRDFCFWLRGYFEVLESRNVTATSNMTDLNAAQVTVIKRHLAMVFVHDIDPSMGGAQEQAKLDAAHSPGAVKIGGVDTNTGMVYRC